MSSVNEGEKLDAIIDACREPKSRFFEFEGKALAYAAEALDAQRAARDEHVWTTADGRRIPLSGMSDQHLAHAVARLRRLVSNRAMAERLRLLELEQASRDRIRSQRAIDQRRRPT